MDEVRYYPTRKIINDGIVISAVILWYYEHRYYLCPAMGKGVKA